MNTVASPSADGRAVAGVDGCRGGWVVVTGLPDGTLTAELVDGLAALVGDVRSGTLAVACVDMPIGLLSDRPRPADIEARTLLGPRRSTVFPAPVRPVLDATDYNDACNRSREAHGRALSKQTYNLVPAIRHLDELLTATDVHLVVEAHPELAFARLDGGRPLSPKRFAEGQAHRQRLLSTALGAPFEALLAQRSAPLEDLLDATALVITARHLVAGTAHHLGGGVLDDTGKVIQVVY